MICSICKQLIRKGNDIIVLSFPLKSLNENGDYSVVHDFMENEKVVHLSCGKNIVESFKGSPLIKIAKIENDYPDVNSFRIALSTIGEKVSVQELKDFIDKNEFNCCSQEDLLKNWLSLRNKS